MSQRGEAALRGTHSQAALGNDSGTTGGISRVSGAGLRWGLMTACRGGIPDIFIPPTMIDNAGVRGGRNENSGMTTGDAPGSESQGDVWRGWIVPVGDAIPDRRRGEAELRGDAFPSGAWERQRDDRGNLRRQRGGTPMGTHDRMSEGIPDIFIPPTMIGNAGFRGGRNENSGMTTGDATGSESQGDVWRGWIVPVGDAIHDRRRGEAELRGDAFPSRAWERQRTTETTG